MNCSKYQEENDLDCESRCWKCGEKLSHDHSTSYISQCCGAKDTNHLKP